MGKRRLAREIVLQALYVADVSKLPGEDALAGVLAGTTHLDAPSKDFCKGLLTDTLTHLPELDALLRATADNWALDRMTAVDRCILRMASCELLHHADTPVGVAIDEALEIAKKFSSEQSARFINGLLDKIKTRRPAETKKI